MAMSEAGAKTSLIGYMNSVIGAAPPEGIANQAKFAEAFAKWLVNYLKENMELDGATCNGATGTGPDGGPLPISDQPVTGGVK